MKYLSVDEAKDLAGLRLVLTAGVPGPFGEAAKAVFRHHNVEFTPVRQVGGRDNPELVAWTRHRNAPIALYNNEPPRTKSIEIVDLAERLGSGPSLYPSDIAQRVDMVGLLNEIAGEYGLVWQARLLMLDATVQILGEEKARRNPMLTDYRYEPGAVEGAKVRLKEIIDYLVARIRDRKTKYLASDTLSAVDIYYAYFSNLFAPQSHDINPMPDSLRQSYELPAKLLGEFDPVLVTYRDEIFSEHLQLPVTF